MPKTYKTSAPPTRKPRNSWPRDVAPTTTPRDPVDRIMARIERREIHDSQKQARLDRKRNAVIAQIETMQHEGRIVTTNKTPRQLVDLMTNQKVDELYQKLCR